MPHISLYISRKSITGYPDGLVADYPAQGDYSDLGGSTTNIDDHVPRRRLHRKANPDGRSHGFGDHVNYLCAGRHGGGANRPTFKLGNP